MNRAKTFQGFLKHPFPIRRTADISLYIHMLSGDIIKTVRFVELAHIVNRYIKTVPGKPGGNCPAYTPLSACY
jgi:hypothetical protein